MSNIVDFAHLDEEDTLLIGVEGTKLAKMISFGLPVENGFVISSSFFDQFLAANNIIQKIKKLSHGVNFDDPFDLFLLAKKIEKELDMAIIPDKMKKEVISALKKYLTGTKLPFTIYPSPVSDEAEVTNTVRPYTIFSEEELFWGLKKCWKSQFNPFQLSKYTRKGESLFSTKVAVVVQKKVFGDISGIIYTSNPRIKNTCLIYAVWGLCDENLPKENFGFDLYTVDLQNGEIIDKEIGYQETQLVQVGDKVEELPLSLLARNVQKLTDEHLQSLVKLTKQVVKHYFFPQLITWTIKKNRIIFQDLRPQPLIVEPQIEIEDSRQPKKNAISQNKSRNFRRTATKILLKLENSQRVGSLQDDFGNGFILEHPNVLWNEICPKLKQLSWKVDPYLLFFHFPFSSLHFLDFESIRNTLEGFNSNFALILPAPLWSEKLKSLTKEFEIPVWVSCQCYQDFLFLEQYILWGAKGIVISPQETFYSRGLTLKEKDGLMQMFKITAKTGDKYRLGRGLALGKDNLSFEYLRQAVFDGFSFVAVPESAYLWSQEEVRLAERELVTKKHG